MTDWQFILRSIGSALIITSLVFILRASYKHLSEKYDRDAVLLIKVIAIAILIISTVFIFRGKDTIKNELSKLSIQHILQIIGVSIGIAIAIWVGARTIEIEDVSHYSFTHTSIEILVAILGSWLLFSEKLNMGRMIGLACILSGVIIIGSHPI